MIRFLDKALLFLLIIQLRSHLTEKAQQWFSGNVSASESPPSSLTLLASLIAIPKVILQSGKK